MPTRVDAGFSGWVSGVALVPILGIPAGAFIAALVASALNNTNEEIAGRAVPGRLKVVLFDALVGGWIAMGLVKLPAFKDYGVAELGVTIAAALVTLCVPSVREWLRDNWKVMAGETWGIFRDWLKSRFGGSK